MIRIKSHHLLSLVAVAATALNPASASAQVARVINFYNACSSPIEFIINHSNGMGNWHPHGWYKLQPYQSSTFTETAGGAALTQMDGYSLYFYARSTDGTDRTWSGSNRQMFQNAEYPFMKMATTTSSDGSLRASITCDN